MSKVDAQRAMKAARHARTPAPTAPPVRRPDPEPAAPAVPAPASGPATAAARAVAGVAAPVLAAPPAPGAALCGHRNMAGKECRRPAGHAEKSHRYA